MNDTLHLLAHRRSVNPAALRAPGPGPQEIETLLTLAARVPDHGKLAPWRFILFADDARLRAGEVIARIFAQDAPDASADRLDIERTRLSRAPLVIGVVSRAAPHVKIPEWEQVLSAGAVCMNLTIAANAMGYATSWMTEWYAYDRRVLAAFGIQDHEKVAGFVHIGRSEFVPEDRVRPVLADIVSHFS